MEVALERRRKQRREQVDRRAMIRFEPDKEQRRSGKDRREQNDTWAGRDKV
jgi:hypothetical protein